MGNKATAKPSGIKCWNCGTMMNETQRWFTCPKCGATDTILGTLEKIPTTTPGQAETKQVYRGKRKQ